jgi:hypothetical protein
MYIIEVSDHMHLNTSSAETNTHFQWYLIGPNFEHSCFEILVRQQEGNRVSVADKVGETHRVKSPKP